MTTVFRSFLFNAAFYLWTAVLLVVLLPLLAAPQNVVLRAVSWWSESIVRLLRVTAGVRFEVRGREHIPEEPAIIASKHQSAWDTLIFFLLLPRPTVVTKKELFLIPFYSWFVWRTGMIGVDRAGGAEALKSMVRRAAAALKAGRSVIIFPEGTRTAPGTHRPYLPGVAALYGHLKVPVVPVAVNSGLFWGRRTFVKRPGTILLQFLPAIPPGLARDDFMAELERRIETATARLEAEA
ncbi:MAG: lysophospholipid acyltransferase family protein [Alphaproteobacteria bacterium]